MRYQDILNEAWRANELDYSPEEMSEAILDEAPIGNDLHIVRTAPTAGNKRYAFGNSLEHTRKSANTTNYYTLMLDNFPNWSDFPKRSKSWICTLGTRPRGPLSQSYRMFPVGDPLVGICPTDDIWVSFRYLKKNAKVNISLLNEHIEDAVNNLSIHVSDEDYEEFKNMIWKIGVQIKKDPTDIPDSLETIWNIGNGDLLEGLQEVMDPWKNNFDLKRLSEIDKSRAKNSGKEIWFAGETYLVKMDEVDEIWDYLNWGYR